MKLSFAALACILLCPIFSLAQAGGASISINPGPASSDQPATFSQTTTKNTAQQQQVPPCTFAMDFKSYKAAKTAVASASFEDTKLSTAKSILVNNCLSTDQIIDVCRAFGFEASKLDFAKTAYSKTTDQANYNKVVDMLTTSTAKTDLKNYISNHAK
jgi:uncharacterized protein DUF4476